MRTLANLWPAIVGMALVTYGTRIGGLWIVDLARETPRLARLLHHLATAVLAALIIAAFRDGDAGIRLAAVVAIVLMRTTGQMLTAIGGAVITAALVRMLMT